MPDLVSYLQDISARVSQSLSTIKTGVAINYNALNVMGIGYNGVLVLVIIKIIQHIRIYMFYAICNWKMLCI